MCSRKLHRDSRLLRETGICTDSSAELRMSPPDLAWTRVDSANLQEAFRETNISSALLQITLCGFVDGFVHWV